MIFHLHFVIFLLQFYPSKYFMMRIITLTAKDNETKTLKERQKELWMEVWQVSWTGRM